MKFPILKIGKFVPKYPIIQGGMAIRASMSKLAAAVANQGGIGVIAGSAIPAEELKEEIRKAKSMTKGIIAVNIMFAVTDFKTQVIAAVEAGVDFVISGAGFSRDMFTIGKEAGVPIVPIVSSLKLAKIAEKLGAAAIVVEGGNAGGHLGTDKDSWDIVKEIKDGVSIPVIGAGGVVTPEDAKRMFDMGLDGVQMGTRFIATDEADVADAFKELYVNSGSADVVTIESSAGLPANAIRTKFAQMVIDGTAPKPSKCNNCLKHCTRVFCVNEALVKGHAGDMELGLFFTGRDLDKVKSIMSVEQVFKEMIEYEG